MDVMIATVRAHVAPSATYPMIRLTPDGRRRVMGGGPAAMMSSGVIKAAAHPSPEPGSPPAGHIHPA